MLSLLVWLAEGSMGHKICATHFQGEGSQLQSGESTRFTLKPTTGHFQPSPLSYFLTRRPWTGHTTQLTLFPTCKMGMSPATSQSYYLRVKCESRCIASSTALVTWWDSICNKAPPVSLRRKLPPMSSKTWTLSRYEQGRRISWTQVVNVAQVQLDLGAQMIPPIVDCIPGPKS